MLHIGKQKFIAKCKISYIGDYEERLLADRLIINVVPEGKTPKSIVLTSENEAYITFLSSWSLARRYGGIENE